MLLSKIKNIYNLPNELIEEAKDYAFKSRRFTSNRHDFHPGGLNNKEKKMYQGKLGEKIFKLFLLESNISFQEDCTSYDEADLFDFILPDGKTIDVKTRTEAFHTRTLEMVEEFIKNPKDIYISIKLFEDNKSGQILGWVSKKDIMRINRIENHGFLNNYTIYDNELRSIDYLWEILLNKFVVEKI